MFYLLGILSSFYEIMTWIQESVWKRSLSHKLVSTLENNNN